MTLIHVSIDAVMLEELLVAAIGAFAALVGLIAVLKTPSWGRGSPNETEETTIPVLAGRLSINVAAQNRTSDPLNLRFTLSDPAVTLFRIEIANQLDNEVGCIQCVKEAPRVFVATVEPKVVQRWYIANPYWDGETKQLPIRAFFMTNGRAECRTIWVTMSPRTIPISGFLDLNDSAWLLEGPCLAARPTLVIMPSRTGTSRR
jgi:hypothetical protein